MRLANRRIRSLCCVTLSTIVLIILCRELFVMTQLTTETTAFDNPLKEDVTRELTTVETFAFKQEKVNEFKQKFLRSPVAKCSTITTVKEARSNGSKSILLFMVKSAPQNIERRNVIRNTWGNESFLYSDIISIRTVFILGLPPNVSVNTISEEFNVYQDIIQVNFIDNYFNNTLKTISNINWASKYCRRAKYVVLLDDDFFVNPRNLITMLDGLPVEKSTRLYMGRVFEGYQPHRDPKSKWFVSESEYPFKKYPIFVSAGTIILSMSVVLELQESMEYLKPFRLDDVYVAIVAQHLKIRPRAHPHIYTYAIFPSQNDFQTVITAHGYKTQEIEIAWKHLFPSLRIHVT